MKSQTVLFTLFALLLTACATPAPQVTVTSEVTVTLTPTATATPTFTPTVTFTPTPVLPADIVAAIETALPSVTVEGSRLKLPDGTYPSGLTPTEDGRMTVAGYDFTTQYGETIHMPETTYNLTDFSFNAQNQFCRPAHCWDAESGAWVRAIESFPALEGGMVELEVFSNEEVNAEIAATAKDATPEERVVSNVGVNDIADNLLGRNFFGTSKAHFTYGGMLVIRYSSYAFSDNVLQIENSTNGETELKEVPQYLVVAIGNNGEYALAGWRAGGKDYVRLVDKQGLNDPKKFNSYFEENEPKW